MKNLMLVLALLCLCFRLDFAFSADDHDHAAEKEAPAEKAHGDSHDHSEHAESEAPAAHGDHAEHSDHAEHGEHEEEENSQTGPDKGILAASAETGIKLSPEAEKHFEIKKMKVASTPIEIPKTAIVTAGVEVNVFRFRAGFYKRIDFVQLKKTAKTIVLQSRDLKVGDEIALTGLGFLRTAEIAAFGGAPEGHSH